MLLNLRNASLLYPQEKGALPLPSGIKPNFMNPSSIATSFQAGFGVCVGISGFFVIARTYTKVCVMKKWGLEDYFMWLSWILSACYIVTGHWAMPFGAGVHQWNVKLDTWLEFLKHWNIPMILYNPAICFIKLAILIQFLNIFASARTAKIYWAFISLIVVTVVFYSICLFLRIFQCTPREKIWKPKVPGTCIKVQTIIIASASVNVVLDFVMLLLPIIKVWQLQMPKGKKWAVSIVFGTGFLGCIASVMRLITSIHLNKTKDSTYELLLVGVWCEVEIASGLICYCLPVFPYLYRQRIKNLISAMRPSHTNPDRSGMPNPSFCNRRFDNPRGGKCNQLLTSKIHYIDLDELEGAETKKADSLRQIGINKSVAEVYVPAHDWNCELKSGQIRKTTSVSVASYQVKR